MSRLFHQRRKRSEEMNQNDKIRYRDERKNGAKMEDITNSVLLTHGDFFKKNLFKSYIHLVETNSVYFLNSHDEHK